MEETATFVLKSKVDWSTEPTPVPADLAYVASATDQFSITFCCSSPGGAPDKDGKVPAKVVASIRLSALNFIQLHDVLSTIRRTWESQHKEMAEAILATMGKTK
jgi:hypothetical protein